MIVHLTNKKCVYLKKDLLIYLFKKYFCVQYLRMYLCLYIFCLRYIIFIGLSFTIIINGPF